jgi:hypothetical protein
LGHSSRFYESFELVYNAVVEAAAAMAMDCREFAIVGREELGVVEGEGVNQVRLHSSAKDPAPASGGIIAQ